MAETQDIRCSSLWYSPRDNAGDAEPELQSISGSE